MVESMSPGYFTELVVREYAALKAAADAMPRNTVSISGQSLTVAEVVSVAMYGTSSQVADDAAVHQKVQQSVEFLERELALGHNVYGVTTGFGGSADTRTGETEVLQDGLVKMLNAGILIPSDKGKFTDSDEETCAGLLRSHALPRAIVKAAMLIRSNSLLRGHSGVRMNIINTVMSLLDKDIVPVVPLRGSISASGDLGPLSYIAGAIQGNPDIHMSIGRTGSGDGRAAETIVTAAEALHIAGLKPQRLQAKEGLGIVNGTSVSAAAAAIVIHRAKQLGLLSQVLTAMGTEALQGTVHNYEPFISDARPHPGQREAAANIANFLQGSRLATQSDPEDHGLAQDRYALRTAPQWIGPQLEDLLLAQQQIEIELNSTTDNPLIDVEGERIHHGGNFQAMSLTSAMEKTIPALQNFGRLLFSQCTELINNKLNNGLPPNLCVDEPSLSYTFKGVDITMAAYMSELASLSHPISPYVVSAEMGNQSLNSLALVAARRALECVEVLSLMSAAYIYTLCQAVDLRCLHLEFVKAAESAAHDIVRAVFGPAAPRMPEAIEELQRRVWACLLENWGLLSHLDLRERCQEASRKSLGHVIEVLKSLQIPATLVQVDDYQTRVAAALGQAYDECRRRFFLVQETANYLGSGSERIYTYVRDHIGVPLHLGFSDQAHSAAQSDAHTNNVINGLANGYSNGTSRHGHQDLSGGMGLMVSQIYLSVCNGKLLAHVLESY